MPGGRDRDEGVPVSAMGLRIGTDSLIRGLLGWGGAVTKSRIRLRRTLGVGATALLIVSLAFAAQPARAEMGRPTWASGDFWVYTLSFADAELGLPNATLRFDVTGTETITVNGTAYSTYRVAATISFVLVGTTTFPADMWFSTETLAIVKIRATVQLNLPGFDASGTFEVSGNPPQTIQWPLTAGASWQSSTRVWTVATNSTGTTYTSVPLSTDFSVQSDATISVPAGTFTTTPLKETDTASGSYTINYWSPQVGNWARVAQHNSTGENEGNFNLTSYNYQAGFFLTAVVLGLPTWIWLIIAAAAVVAIVVVARRRRRGRAPQTMPPPEPPETP